MSQSASGNKHSDPTSLSAHTLLSEAGSQQFMNDRKSVWTSAVVDQSTPVARIDLDLLWPVSSDTQARSCFVCARLQSVIIDQIAT